MSRLTKWVLRGFGFLATGCALALTVFFLTIDLSDKVVPERTGAGVVLVTDKAVLLAHSARCDAEWMEAPPARLVWEICKQSWQQSPPAGVLVSPGTKLRVLDRKFLQQGQLLDPYPANTYDMQRNRALEVDFVRVKEGPQRNLKGWVPSGYLQGLYPMP